MYLCAYLRPHLTLSYYLSSSSGRLTEITFRNLGLSKNDKRIYKFFVQYASNSATIQCMCQDNH